MGTTLIEKKADIWLSVIKNKIDIPDVVALAEKARTLIAAWAADRNSVMHVFFVVTPDPTNSGIYGWATSGGYSSTASSAGLRNRNLKIGLSADELDSVRLAAAQISVWVAEIEHRIASPDARSPFADRLNARLPARLLRTEKPSKSAASPSK